METPLPSTPSFPCCSPKSKLICLSAGLAAIIIVAVASFLFGRASVKPLSLSQALPTPTVSLPTPTPTPDETANWKTYANAEYGYSVKYPASWYLYEPQGQTAGEKNTIGFWPKKTEGETQGVWISVRDDRFSFTNLDDWWEKYKERLLTPLDEFAIKEKQFLKDNFNDLFDVNNTSVDSKRAIKFESTSAYQSRPFKNVFVLDSNHQIIDINTNIPTDPVDMNSKVFNLLLSTFQFLD